MPKSASRHRCLPPSITASRLVANSSRGNGRMCRYKSQAQVRARTMPPASHAQRGTASPKARAHARQMMRGIFAAAGTKSAHHSRPILCLTRLSDILCSPFLKIPIFARYSKSSSVPTTKSPRPAAAFRSSFSFKNSHENRMVTRMLSLSMGTTMLAWPSCSAR